MAMDDLYKALQMFGDGVQQLQTSRAIGAANDQVQQIHASEASEQAKRAQLQQIANGLTAHLAQLGTPATTMQAVAGAIGPKQYANANDMNRDALLTGNSQLGQEAQKQQEFESNPKFELAKLKASHSALEDKFKEMQMQNLEEDRTNKMMKGVFEKANPNLQGRGPLGVLQKKINQMQEVQPLTQDPNLTLQQLNELPQVLNSALSAGGVGNVQGMQHLTPNTMNQNLARMKEMLTSNPQAVKLPEFQKMYADTIDRVNEIAQSQIGEGVKGALKAQSRVALRDPNAFTKGAAALIPNDPVVSVDKDKGVVFQSDLDQKLVADSINHVLGDKQLSANAAAILDKIREDKPAAWAVTLRNNPKLRALVSKQFK